MHRVVALALMVACSSRSVEGEGSPLAMESTLELVPQWSAPDGADGGPRYLVRLRRGEEVRSVDTGGPVTHAVLFDEQVVSVDAAHRMRMDAQVVAENVYGAPVVAAGRLAYVVVREGATVRSEVHVRDATVDRVIDASLYQVGALRFSPDGQHLVGIGARDGGVAGLHVFDVRQRTHRCLTHCELVAGWPLGADYQAPRADFEFAGDTLVWPGGSVRWR